MTGQKEASPEAIIRDIKRKARRKFTAEEKIRIVLDGLRGEASINDHCRKEGIHPTMYYKWSKAFLEAGKRQLNGDTIREAGSDEVKELRTENDSLKMVVAELTLQNRKLKKTSDEVESGSDLIPENSATFGSDLCHIRGQMWANPGKRRQFGHRRRPGLNR